MVLYLWPEKLFVIGKIEGTINSLLIANTKYKTAAKYPSILNLKFKKSDLHTSHIHDTSFNIT